MSVLMEVIGNKWIVDHTMYLGLTHIQRVKDAVLPSGDEMDSSNLTLPSPSSAKPLLQVSSKLIYIYDLNFEFHRSATLCLFYLIRSPHHKGFHCQGGSSPWDRSELPSRRLHGSLHEI